MGDRHGACDYGQQARNLLADLATTPAERRWDLPFPMGVFGTLRAGCRNHRLMRRIRVRAERLAFLPNFIARDIGLVYRQGSCAPFEVYFYDSGEWDKIISPLDRLEDFQPGRWEAAGYQRTLAWLHLLPQGFQHAAYALAMLGQERDLQIGPQMWHDYERIPGWIYSNVQQNRLAAAHEGSPLIWDGVVVR